jgi:hypothetical protein
MPGPRRRINLFPRLDQHDVILAAAPALAGVCGKPYLKVQGAPGGSAAGGLFGQTGRSRQMAQLLSTPQAFQRTSGPARLARAVVIGGVALGVLLLLAAAVLWLHYGSTVFFEMIASGFAACF